MTGPAPLLEVRNLSVAYQTGAGPMPALRNVSLSIRPGESYGLVGESGSGKSTLALAILRALPANGLIQGGQVLLDGLDLLSLTQPEMRQIWGAKIALVPQDPLSALNPSLRLGEQMAEILRYHGGLRAEAAAGRAIDLLESVQIADPERVARSYPHEISGGMQQRVMIAMALSTEPKLLVLDEPTTSLDTTTQAAMLDLVRELLADHEASALYVSHNLGVVAQVCDRVAVLYASELVEDAATVDLYRKPLFPYTQGLFDSVPRLGDNKHSVRLRPIEGRVPALNDLPQGCIFRPRCPLAIPICAEDPPLYHPSDDRSTRCHRWQEIDRGEISARQPEPDLQGLGSPPEPETVLAVEGLRVSFSQTPSILAAMRGEPATQVKAVDGVSLEILRGTTVGLVGESGSGKTTIARAIVGLTEATEGEIDLFSVRLPKRLNQRGLNTLCHLQMVFQNPQEALNPYLTVRQTLAYPLRHLRGLSAAEADRLVGQLLLSVHLPEEYGARLPGQLSGGEKQRVAVARAFASEPDLLIADEPVTSLDVSVQASLLNLLNELQAEKASSYLFISHDLAVVGYLADSIAVIYLGQLMEVGSAKELFDPPYHPYTEALLSAIPLIDPLASQEQIRLTGEIPSPVDAPGGCPFHTRCPRFLGEICVEQRPPWRSTKSGKRVYCHIPVEELEASQKRAFQFQSRGQT
ncbi:MAG: ABC transporter ATP-binding protein [Anaerolineales bacterium]